MQIVYSDGSLRDEDGETGIMISFYGKGVLSMRLKAYVKPSVEFTALYTVENQFPNFLRSPEMGSRGVRV